MQNYTGNQPQSLPGKNYPLDTLTRQEQKETGVPYNRLSQMWDSASNTGKMPTAQPIQVRESAKVGTVTFDADPLSTKLHGSVDTGENVNEHAKFVKSGL